MIENLLYLGFILLVEYFSYVSTKEESQNYLAKIFFFISGLCFGYYVARVTKIVANKYAPTYQEDYRKLPRYERDMMSYIDYIRYKSMRYNSDSYYSSVKVVNFDIINHECRGDKLVDTYKYYKTIQGEHQTIQKWKLKLYGLSVIL